MMLKVGGCFLMLLATGSWAHGPSASDDAALSASPTLSQWLEVLRPTPERLFYSPASEEDLELLAKGQSTFSKHYPSRKLASLQAAPFKGYIMGVDPFVRDEKRVSFLLGSDCSHFVHRLYQLLGADYPYSKTADLYAFASQASPATSRKPGSKWQKLAQSFEVVDPHKERLESGDLAVFPSGGRRVHRSGHMGILWQLPEKDSLQILHAKNRRTGYVLEDFEPHLRRYKVLRWKAPLKDRDTMNLEELLNQSFENN
jgi:hypothetical protein